jgi:predicted outer membrane protein
MVDDYSKANDQLKQVASEESITLPGKLDAKDAATKARLEKLSGEQFDHACMLNRVRDHTKDVAAFRTEAKTAKDPAIKNFAFTNIADVGGTSEAGEEIEPHTMGATHKSKSQIPTRL